MSCDRYLLIQWYSRTPARPPTTNAEAPVTTVAISKVATALQVVGVLSVVMVVGVLSVVMVVGVLSVVRVVSVII